MKLKIIFGILLALVMFNSCITKEKCARFYPPQVSATDSVLVKVTERVTDTIFRITEDSSWLKALIKCDSLGQAYITEIDSYKQGKRTSLPHINLRNNVLTAGCSCDSVQIYALLKNRETITDNRSNQTITQPAVKVKFIPGWMWFFGITGMIAWGVAFVIMAFKLCKKSI